ncbi:hypothetical protein B9Z55_022503 [Caenorhabditis nigoni]|uniref:aspartate transaminase n=1 Tax=Caenorhabditis nigoni TaxID=1611254 RepID=A0A2G5SKX4_9PELO|nr:hypothetical protein B9Z55_022503 [Caenorhabditis nigoni]
MTQDEILHSPPSVFDTCITPSIVKKEVIQTFDLTRKSYCNHDGEPEIFPVVQRLEVEYARGHCPNYLPILGHEGFRKAATELALGSESPAILENRAVGIQSLSGTGALRSGADFLFQILQIATVYLPNPSWDVHYDIFRYAGFTNVRTYRYCDVQRKTFNMESMLQDLQEASKKSVVLLHASAHVPSGITPSMEQWKMIARVVKQRKLFPFFYLDQQGLASGDLEQDSWPIRYFVHQGLELFVAQSFSKIFGLYSETVGNLIAVVNDVRVIESVNSQFTLLNVSRFSNPPAFGAFLVHQVLTSPCLRKEWLEQLKRMTRRMRETRLALSSALAELGTPGTWTHIGRQSGLYCSLGLTRGQINYLREKHNFQLFKNGCLNMSCLNKHNIENFAKALDSTIKKTL